MEPHSFGWDGMVVVGQLQKSVLTMNYIKHPDLHKSLFPASALTGVRVKYQNIYETNFMKSPHLDKGHVWNPTLRGGGRVNFRKCFFEKSYIKCPDLHKNFISSLHPRGGGEVPKQLFARYFMNVQICTEK